GGAGLVAVHARQHDVEDDGVVGILPGHPETVGAGQRDVGREALRLQALLEPGRKPLLVIHDQDPHHPTSSPISPCCAAPAERELNPQLVLPESRSREAWSGPRAIRETCRKPRCYRPFTTASLGRNRLKLPWLERGVRD